MLRNDPLRLGAQRASGEDQSNMKIYLLLSLILSATFIPPAHAADKSKPALPPVPDVLKPLKAAISDRKDVGLTLALQSDVPLNDEQWSAVEALHIRSLILTNNVSDDAAMARFAKLDPIALQFSHSPMTDAGAARFAEMKSLKVLRMSHTDRLTPKSAVALADHPALEVFANDGKFGIGGMAQIAKAKHLRDILLQHGVASDANIALLAHHPGLEVIKLWPSGTAVLSDAALAPLATIPNLKELTLELSAFTYAGGLNWLQDIPKLSKLALNDVIVSDEDVAKLKADLPNVKITVTPMKPEYRAKWNEWKAKGK
jgi:hypothetical protein